VKIVNVDAIVCRASVEAPLWSLQPYSRGRYRLADHVETTIVKLASNDGLVGYGETPGVSFHGPKIISIGTECKRLIERIVAPKILGKNLLDNSIIWRRIHQALKGEPYGRLTLSGLDIALWDLIGRSLDLPIYRLLGGRYRRKIKLYASKIPGIINLDNDEEAETLAKRLSRTVDEGYSAFKLGGGLGVEADTRSVEIARETVGEKCKIMLDAGCAYNLEDALKLGKRLEDLHVEWFEAPLHPNEMDGYVKLADRLKLKIATDVHPEPNQVIKLLVKGGVGVVLSDITAGGGITISRKIVELTDLFNVEFSTHAGWNITSIGYAGSAQLSAVVPNLNFQEGRIHYSDNPFGDRILMDPIRVTRGFLHVPDGPGLGVKVNEEALCQCRIP